MELQIKEIKTEIFRQEYTPASVNKIMRENGLLSPAKALQQTDISLAKLNKQFGYEVVEDYLKKWLLNLNKFMFRDVSKMQSIDQVNEIAEILAGEYYYYNILEVALCFRYIKSGKFGKMYGELTGQYIIDAFEQYRLVRFRAIEQIRNEKQQRYLHQLYAADKVQERSKALKDRSKE